MEMHGRGELARFLTEKTKGRQMMFLNTPSTHGCILKIKISLF